MVETFWNGEPCTARKVIVIVGDAPLPTWWCAGLAGQQRKAVEVIYADQPPFYLDNDDGRGWDKVTVGRGSPHYPHSSLPVASVVGEDS